jgi:hypothetical protein
MLRFRLTFALITPWLLSCYSTSLVQEPQTLPAKGFRAAVSFAWDPERTLSALPMPAIGLRYGLVDRLEARAKVSLFGGELGIDAELIRNQSFRLNVLPHVAVYQEVFEDDDDYLDEEPRGRSHNIRALAVPVILSLRASDHVELFAGPTQHVGLRDAKTFYAVGAHAGLVFHYGRHVTQILECSLLVGVAGQHAVPGKPYTYPDGSQSYLTVGDLTGQCGVGMSFGSAHAKPEAAEDSLKGRAALNE